MRTPSARCQPHRALLRFHNWTTDEDGGRRVTSYTESPSVSCFVQPGVSKLIIEESSAEGQRRVTETTPTKVYFVTDPSLNAEDLIYFVETSGRTHWYKVLATFPPSALGNLWIAECEERR